MLHCTDYILYIYIYEYIIYIIVKKKKGLEVKIRVCMNIFDLNSSTEYYIYTINTFSGVSNNCIRKT